MKNKTIETKNHYPVYMQGELIALYPKNPTTKKLTLKESIERRKNAERGARLVQILTR